jgi:hypothetical protein
MDEPIRKKGDRQVVPKRWFHTKKTTPDKNKIDFIQVLNYYYYYYNYNNNHGSTALYMGLGLLFPRLLGLVHLWHWAHWPRCSTQSWCDCQSHLAVSQETWVRNGRRILLTSITSFIHAGKVLLHAVNLRHGTDGFTSPPKEVVLRIFNTLKIPSTSAGIEPANLGSSG